MTIKKQAHTDKNRPLRDPVVQIVIVYMTSVFQIGLSRLYVAALDKLVENLPMNFFVSLCHVWRYF